MSILYQNIPQLQNRYPDGQWRRYWGGCDTSLFLGCNDMTTATYFSGRSGEVTVGYLLCEELEHNPDEQLCTGLLGNQLCGETDAFIAR